MSGFGWGLLAGLAVGVPVGLGVRDAVRAWVHVLIAGGLSGRAAVWLLLAAAVAAGAVVMLWR